MASSAYVLALFEGVHQRWGQSRSRHLDGLFAQQRAFVADPAKRKAALCGRRAGKTEALVAWLLDGCEQRPGETNVYISLSQKHARRILWTTLKRAASRHGIALAYNEQALIATHPNGARIWVTGCPDQSQCEDFRGDRYFRVAIDEAQSFPPWIEYLVNDVLDPALMDLGGELALSGSPGFVPAGFFYDATAGDLRWPAHHWTCLDNPHVPGAAYLDRKRAENRWDEAHPTYRREYLGQWVHDDEAIVYPYRVERNGFTVLPEEGVWVRVLSLDLGFEPDGCAFVISAARRGFPDLYVERAWREHRLTPQRIAGRLQQVMHEQRLAGRPLHRLVCDEGALGKAIAQGLREDGIPISPAEKADKRGAIHTVKGALLAGTLHVHPFDCRQLIEEWQILPWNDDRSDHDARFVDDCSDSLLYGYRAHRLLYSPEEVPPAPGTPAHDEAERRRQYEATRREVLARNQPGRRRR